MAVSLSVSDAAHVEEVERLASNVEGWLSAVEGRLLYELARDVDAAACIVEIGSWKGRSTVWLAAGAKAGRGARVVAIDPHQGSSLHAEGESTEHALRRNLHLALVSEQVDVVVDTSEGAVDGWDRPIGLLWIDGDHAYESVRRDFLLWEGYVADGGIVALHDTLFWDGPGRVVSEYLEREHRYSGLGYAHTITYASRRLSPTAGQLFRKRIAIVARNVHGVGVRAYADNRFRLGDLVDASRRRKASRRGDLPRSSGDE
jgi:predicted O-methyltransferase YrrM